MDAQVLQSHPTSPGNEAYTVIVRGERFELYHDQITFDSPNYFTSCFLSDFAVSAGHTLKLSRNPTLFAIIVEYLSGYPVLPLSVQAIPSSMDMVSAHRCLLADAEFFGLQRLCELLENRGPEIDLRWTGHANETVSLRDVVKGKLPAGVRRDDGTLTSVSSGLPPLVFAKGVVFTLLVNTTFKAELAEQALLSCPYSKMDPYLAVSVRLTSSSTLTTPSTDITLSLNPSPMLNLSTHAVTDYGSFCKSVAREHYWEQLDGRPVQEFRHVYIDEKLYDFDRICSLDDFLARVRLLDTLSDGERMLRWREVLYVWWADEALFQLVPRGHQVGTNTPDDALAADMVCARLRTRQKVLRDVRIRDMTGEGDD